MKLFLNLLLALFFAQCSHQHHQHHENKMPKESNVKISHDLKGHRWANIYFSGQPSQKALSELKNNGFAAVINLREKKEGKYIEQWEKDLVEKSGIAYFNFPYTTNSGVMSDEYINAITEKVVQQRKKGKVLIHCSSGNRVGIWLGSHFKKDHGFSNELSFKLAKELGLTNSGAQKILLKYLKN